MHLRILIVCFFLINGVILHAQTEKTPLLTITESAVAYAEVDEIHFRVLIESHADDIAEARAKNRQLAESIFDFLDDMKVPDQYIQTERMSLSRNYLRNQRSSGEYDGFKTAQSIYVCLQEADRYDEIIDGLLVMDVSSIKGPEFKSTRKEEVIHEARIEALKKAKKKATELADALGQEIGDAKFINTSVSQNASNSSYSTGTSPSNQNASNTSFKMGEIRIAAVVEVSFELR